MKQLTGIITTPLLACLIMVLYMNCLAAQTIINQGEVNGLWTKKASPYLVKGDVNIPAGKTLIIQPGTVVKFDGQFVLNVQGTLIAAGTAADSILFTATDTSSINQGKKYGWNGIRFDRRPVGWDTSRFIMPEDEELKMLFDEQIRSGELDTATKVCLVLQIPDEVKDTLMPDSVFASGSGSRLAYCRFEYATSFGKPQPYVFGGAVYIYRYSNLLISHCVFENNLAYAGGAIYCKEAAPVVINNRIIRCSAQSSGGAMVFIHAGPVLIGNTLKNNASGFNGGGILFYESSPYAVSNTLLGNSALNSGGGMYCEKKIDDFLAKRKYQPIEKLTFTRDAAFDKTNLSAISLRNAGSFNGRFHNNVVCGNKAATGGGIGLCAINPEFTNNTLADNQADTAGGGLFCYYSAPLVTNTIVYGNAREQVFLSGDSRPVFRFCDVQSGLSGVKKDTSCKVSFEYSGILDVAPKFAGPTRGDYSLTAGSGCIDAGMPDTATLKLPVTDMAGKNRVLNRRIDLGALEYTGSKTALKSTREPELPEEAEPEPGMETATFTSVFPNPSSGEFTVVIHNNKYETVTVKIVSQSGQLVFTQNYNAGAWFETPVDLSAKPGGIYVILIHAGETLLYNGEIIID